MDYRIWVLIGALSIAAPAGAASGSDAATEEARRHVSDAKVAYTLGEFDKAIASWKEAYRLKPLPAILFNLAQAYRMSGDYKESRFQYENYLRGLPNAPNRLEVERRIEELAPLIAAEREARQVVVKDVAAAAEADENQMSAGPPEESEAPAVESTPNDPVELSEGVFTTLDNDEPSHIRWAPWAVAVVAAACAAGSVVTYTLARGDWSDAASEERKRLQVDALIGAGDARHGVALALGAAAAAAGVGSAVLFVF